MIYLDALHEPSGLLFRKDGAQDGYFKVRTEEGDGTGWGMDANRLKFVCRQVYKETHGLGFANTDVHFENIQDLSYFLTMCSTRSIDSLGTSHVHNKKNFLDEADHDAEKVVISKCRQSPSLRVHFRMTDVDLDKGDVFLSATLQAVLVGRDRSLFQAIQERNPRQDPIPCPPELSLYRTVFKFTGTPYPANIRLFPTKDSICYYKIHSAHVLDEDDFCRDIFRGDLDFKLDVVRYLVWHGF